MLHGTIRLFTNHDWVWSEDDRAWFETHDSRGQHPTGVESEHFAMHKQTHLQRKNDVFPEESTAMNYIDELLGELLANGKIDGTTSIGFGGDSGEVALITGGEKTADQLTIEALQASLADKERLLEKLFQDRNDLYQRDSGMGGVYRRQDRKDMENSDLLEEPGSLSFNHFERMNIVWSRSARMKFRISGQVSLVEACWFHSLPYNVIADSWWHLCAQIGLTEPMARLFYYHPENGQPSAVAKAKPVQRGPIITCQGDYFD